MRRRSALAAVAVIASSMTAVAATSVPAVSAAGVPAGFTDSFVAGFDSATAVEWLPTGQIVVLEQSGRVRISEPGGSFTTALSLTVCSTSERGLLGLTPDPGFLGNGHVFVYYTHPGPSGCRNRVSRFTLNGSSIDPSSEVVLLDNIASTGGNHNGGDLDFDGDGNLLVAIGDAGTDPRGNSGSAGSNDAAQDLSLLNGKIVRITRDGRPAAGNPFSGSGTIRCATAGVAASPSVRCQEIASWGLRNPYRIAVDRNDGTGRYFINDVGQRTFEEINEGVTGADYGWPSREGSCPQGRTPPCADPPAGVTDPIVSYGRSLGTYVTGGAFVPNGLWPAEYDGGYLFGDGGSGRIWLRRADGSVDLDAPFATGAFGLTDMTFGFDTNGTSTLYYVSVGGGLRTITPTSIGAQPTASGLKLVPVEPFRAYDTGDLTGGPAGDVFNGTTRLVDLDPPAGAEAALVNVTYDQTDGPGFLRTWAARTRRPVTSSLNADAPTTLAANAAVVALADDGSFVVESSTSARVVVDVMGWFVPAAGATDDGRFVALDPGRVVDTRIPAGTTLGSGSPNPYDRSDDQIDIDVIEHPTLPDDATVQAVVISVAAIAGDGAGFVGGFPGGTPYRGTSNVNVRIGETRANMMVIPVGADGSVSLRTSNIADVVVDVLGYVTSDLAPAVTSGLYNTIDPTRIVDTRIPLGFPTLSALTADSVAVPAAAGASAVAQNITATFPVDAGWVAAHPGAVAPEVSSVNYDRPGQTRAAFAFTTIAGDDTVSFTSKVRTELVVDVVGYFD